MERKFPLLYALKPNIAKIAELCTKRGRLVGGGEAGFYPLSGYFCIFFGNHIEIVLQVSNKY